MATKAPRNKAASAGKSRTRLTLAANAQSTSENNNASNTEANDNQKNESSSKSETSARAQASEGATRGRGTAAARKSGSTRRTKAATGKRSTANATKEKSRTSASSRGRSEQNARRATENVVNFSARNLRGAFERGAGDAQRLQEHASRFSREGAEQMSRTANVASRAMSESVAIMQGNVETCMQCGNIAADMTRKMSEEAFNFANDMFSSNVEISKDIFACRTINDVFDLQNRMMRTNLDSLFSQSARMSEMVFDYMNQAAEPVSDRLSETTERLTRSIAA